MDNARIKKLANKEPHTYTEKDWQGESDANTLLRAARIRKDTKRLAEAKTWAAVIRQKENEDEELLDSIINE